ARGGAIETGAPVKFDWNLRSAKSFQDRLPLAQIRGAGKQSQARGGGKSSRRAYLRRARRHIQVRQFQLVACCSISALRITADRNLTSDNLGRRRNIQRKSRFGVLRTPSPPCFDRASRQPAQLQSGKRVVGRAQGIR